MPTRMGKVALGGITGDTFGGDVVTRYGQGVVQAQHVTVSAPLPKRPHR